MRRALRAFWLAAIMFCAVAQGHHSFSATYLDGEQIMIEGQVVQLLFRNPHSFIHVMAPDSQGHIQRWAIEWAGAAGLQRDNVVSLKPGDHVIVTGVPGRNPADHRILLRSIVRPVDGWRWNGSVQ